MSADEQSGPKSKRGCASSLGLMLAVPAAGLSFAWLSYGLSWWSAALAVGLWLVVLGLLVPPASRSFGHRVLAAGGLLILGPWLVRTVLVRGSDPTRLTTLPADSGPRLLSRLYPEPDGTLTAAGLLAMQGGLKDPESSRFAEILRQAYARSEPSTTLLPTPAIATYLGLQSPTAFDTIVMRPPERRVAADGALVFLHGYAGNFYVYCWEIAQAAAAANLVTLCPSVGPSGAWWEPSGERTLEAVLDYAHDIGMNRVYLAGLSNGAAGASVLSLKYQERLAAVVLISGVRAEQPPPLPVLVIQGASDQMMQASSARRYAARSQRATYRELPGGHLIFLSEYAKVRPIIAQFLSQLEQRGTLLPGR